MSIIIAHCTVDLAAHVAKSNDHTSSRAEDIKL